ALTTVGVIALSAPFELLEGLSITDLVAAGAAVTSLVMLHASIAYVVGCAVGGRARALSVAAAIAVGGYVVFGLVSSGVIRGARFVTPWHWYLSRNVVAEGAGPEALLLPIGLSIALAALGVWRFTIRDLR
ncbi:MAG: ABC transporter permease subunit, partial [Actinomycetota bacterium]